MSPTLRRLIRQLQAASLTLALTGVALGQAGGPLRTGHAIPGIHGLESSVRPTQGLSFENATISYTSSSQKDRNGHNFGKSGSTQNLSNHTTVTWASPWKILGAHYVTRLRLSLATGAPNPGSLDEGNSGLGLGDTYVEPLALYWQGQKGSISLRYGIWFDTGSFSATSDNNTGKGFKSTQFSLGWTYYFDQDHLWHYSVMTRYSRHGHMSDLDVHPGEDIVVDYNLGKHVNTRWQLGLAGYGVFQTSRDRGTDANEAVGFYGTAALGIISRYSLPEWGGSAYVRFFQEFNSFNRTEGQLAVIGVRFRL